jgi:hypothetical protein
MFIGLSAFPLTPLENDAVAEAAFVRLIGRRTEAMGTVSESAPIPVKRSPMRWVSRM